MLKECQMEEGGEVKEYNSLLQCYSKGESFEAESLFMVLIL
jgi:hypothetical protein